jgi:hypothetical protein
MADLTQRDAGIIERDRMIQFSQYGAAAVVSLHDKSGALLRTVQKKWNRYRKTTRENVTYFRFRIVDSKAEFAADLKSVGDGGFLVVLGSRYRATKVTGWQPGESKIWTVDTNAEDAPSAEFFRAPV